MTNIFLVGPPATGKSIIGKELASQTRKQFVDCDHALEQKLDTSIAEIFSNHGEDYFRVEESKVLLELSQKKNTVIATGGGVVLLEQNRKLLMSQPLVIYLTTSSEILLQRILRQDSRPLLQGDGAEKLNMLLQQREKFYEQVAHRVINTDGKSVADIVEEIVQ